MAKYYGKVGYTVSVETALDVFQPKSVEKYYRGDVVRNSSRWQPSVNLNDDLTINNQISIIADPFAYKNFQHIKYVEWMGQKWKVSTVEVAHPRLILNIGGVWNGDEETEA